MAQERKGEYNASLTSVAENKFRQGLLPSGRYRGFDTMINAGGTGVNITITHTGKGFIRNTFANPPAAETNPYAYIVTPQGVAVETDVTANLTIDATTGGQGYRRVDAVVFEHEYTQVQGGAVGNVIIIKGTESDGTGLTVSYPAAPGLSSPSKQTLLGYIYVNESATFSYSDLNYIPVREPSLSNRQVSDSNYIEEQTGLWAKNSVTLTSIPTGGLPLSSLAPIVYCNFSTVQTLNQINLDKWGNEEIKDGSKIEIYNIGTGNLRIFLGAAISPGGTPLFYTASNILTLDGSSYYDSDNGQRNGSLTVRPNDTITLIYRSSRFYVSSVNVASNSVIADRESGWFRLNSLLYASLPSADLTATDVKLMYKQYFTRDTSWTGGSANQTRFTTSFHLKITFDIAATFTNSIFDVRISADLFRFDSTDFDYITFTGTLYDPTTAGNTQPVRIFGLGNGDFRIQKMGAGTFPNTVTGVQLMFSGTLPCITPVP